MNSNGENNDSESWMCFTFNHVCLNSNYENSNPVFVLTFHSFPPMTANLSVLSIQLVMLSSLIQSVAGNSVKG